ncbi:MULTISPECIES: prolipoprotein diacylglyceryl transferase [Deefgea]|uniref:Phosphatidylglycerol--prolipoprotein diacylglyceryl transferase n=1 Tax=Deefgea chitinilytica TaxID=570276 RepID=A0ABS2CCF2_9NEIS|nr:MULTISPECIES: prolipoprotein diacylglyceryl transferase [Deefgea]MBM5571834.1 prolipoprotein diacylglyceryl transferase [Deefgea chitinilytica]MBM9889069.1 prolipoprotein diacylglyceryl transferase [Deefgea sp. CFH1-16]
MLVHPQFDPVAIHIYGGFGVHWYGLMYLIGFVLFVMLGRWRIRRGNPPGWQTSEMDDLLFYGVMGVILGGRLGYVLFYKPAFYLAHPFDILKVWEGGMAFHGGFLGVLVAMALFGRKTNRSFFQVTDFIAPLVPLGLAAGRLGNFINGELWGRVTDAATPWAMIFPQAMDGLPRHPSQLYQFALEGVLLFVILWRYSAKPRATGQISALFLIGYGAFRFIAEFAREPDDFLGLLAMNLSMGQLLSLPMIIFGLVLLVWSNGKKSML